MTTIKVCRERKRQTNRERSSLIEWLCPRGFIGSFGIFYLLLTFSAVEAGEQKIPESSRDGAVERTLDQQIISNLVKNSSIVVVGEISSQSLAERYKMGLGTNTPFFVKITRVLVGNVPMDKPITVGIARDEYQFRFPKGEPFIFFLEKNLSPPKQAAVFGPGDWRAVADYFGIIPHTLTLERMVTKAAKLSGAGPNSLPLIK